jgi:hypothetical protein
MEVAKNVWQEFLLRMDIFHLCGKSAEAGIGPCLNQLSAIAAEYILSQSKGSCGELTLHRKLPCRL